MLLILSFGAAFSIVPFIFFRFSDNDYLNGSFDVVLFIVFISIGVYILKTRQTEIPRIVLAILSIAALLVGMSINGVERIPWAYPSLLALFFAVKPKLAALMCAFCIMFSLIVLYPELNIFKLATYFVTLTVTCVFAYTFALTTVQQRKVLIKLSRRDPLTDSRNRRAFDEKLEELSGSYRDDFPPTLIILDIDFLK